MPRASKLLLAVIACACATSTQTATTTVGGDVASRIDPEGNWYSYNGPLNGDRYSPLSQINTSNVSTLRLVCNFDAPDSVSLQSGIVAVDGMLYFTAYNNTYAIDGRTCQQRWKHTHPEPPNFLRVNRGVAFENGRLFRGTADGHALAIDAATGRELWDVSIANSQGGESVPLSPIAWNGMLFIGNAGGDNFGVKGRVYALDAATGRTVWMFNTIPDTGYPATTWQRRSAENPPTGGATWTSYALDPEQGILYVTTGNPAPDFVAALHPGENLYSNSLLALDARTGRLLAYVQPTKDDFHDWDLSAPPALIRTTNGRMFVLAGSKDGYVYGIDRANVATSLTTPDGNVMPIRYRTLAATRENAETPLTSDRWTRFCPGSQGGIEWNGPGYHRDLNMLFVNAIDWCTSVKLQRLDTLKGKPGMAWTGVDDPQMAFGRMDSTSMWKGWITAADGTTGTQRWRIQTPKPMVAAITPTAGGLVFTGDLDGNVLALDAQTGRELWRHNTGKAIGGGVISYLANGKQHVAVAAGLNSPIWPVKGGPARVAIFALP